MFRKQANKIELMIKLTVIDFLLIIELNVKFEYYFSIQVKCHQGFELIFNRAND